MTYEYKCPNCGVIEVDKKITEPEVVNCPECGEKVSRIYSPVPTHWHCDGQGGLQVYYYPTKNNRL